MGFYAAAFQELSLNLFVSTSFSLLNHPRHSITAALKVAGLVFVAKSIETIILIFLKKTADHFCRVGGKPPEPLRWDIKLAASIASWSGLIYLQTRMNTGIHPRTVLIAFITSLPTMVLKT